MPPGRRAAAAAVHHLVGLGHVEKDAVEAGLVDALGDVADLDAVGRTGTEGGCHVGARPFGEVLAQLVADDGRAGAQDGHGERARSHAGLEHALTRVRCPPR